MRKPIADLEPGMVLARDLKHRGAILLKAGAELSATALRVLKERGVKAVDVVCESDSHPAGAAADEPDYRADPEYIRERQEIETLFGTVPEDDEQMALLRYCVVCQLEERYRGEP